MKKKVKKEVIKEYDDRGNCIHYKSVKRKFYEHPGQEGWEWWREYDENNNCIYTKYYSKDHGVNKRRREFDEKNRLVCFKDSIGREAYYRYNKEKRTMITKQEFDNIKIREYLSRKKVSRFEIMDI